MSQPTPCRPDVVLILADDLGYSDLGCYGGEVHTPNLDRLASGGVRMTHFHSTPRCSPSRASLLTGLHPHEAGIGILTNDDRPRGYRGNLNDRCVTMAEVLREAGYTTCMTGKWHLANEMREPNDAWPTRRGFDRFFGTLTGCGSYFQPGTLTRGEENAEDEALDPGFFYTDAIGDEASAFIDEHNRSAPDQPFFLYTAFTAPHWPLHAREEDVRRYDGVFEDGWDALRQRRMQRLIELGILETRTKLSERDPSVPAWEDAPDKAWQIRRMQAYAAQVETLDRAIGRILAALENTGRLDNTLIIFLSDNGAAAESIPLTELERFRQRTDILTLVTRDGRPVHIGNDPTVMPGDEDTYASYGRAWANVSNTPFRRYKMWTYKGGIAAPFIVHWPDGDLAKGGLVHTPYQLVHLMPTVLEATGADYPTTYAGRDVLPLRGHSMLHAWRGGQSDPQALYWEHVGNAAIQRGRWKLVCEHDWPWELYDVETDRTELVDLAGSHPAVVAELSAEWERWAERVGVIPFRETLALYRERGLTWTDAIG